MKKKGLIIIIVIVVVLAALAVAAYFILPGILNKDAGEPERETHYYPLDEYFVVNVKDGKGMLFKTTVILVGDSDKLAEVITENEYLIRDKILFTLRALTMEDIQRQTIQDELRISIHAMINEALGIENFYSVLFGDFVMQ